VFAFVVLRGERPTGDRMEVFTRTLRDWVTEQLGAIARPDDIRFSENLPKTRSGKIMRRLLRAIARNEDITQDLSTLENPAIIDQLRGEEPARPRASAKANAVPRKKAAAKKKVGSSRKVFAKKKTAPLRKLAPARKSGESRKSAPAKKKRSSATKAGPARQAARKTKASLKTRIAAKRIRRKGRPAVRKARAKK
jgi:hypothetical protein